MHTPRRVVSLSPNVSMILFALGADTVVVGRTQEDCLWQFSSSEGVTHPSTVVRAPVFGRVTCGWCLAIGRPRVR